MEKILIIAAIIFFAVVIIKNLCNKKTNINEKENQKKPEGIGIKIPKIFGQDDSSGCEPVRISDGTIRFAEWTVYVLDKEGNVLEKKSMNATSENPFSIGYDKDCDLVVKSNYVSRVHLRIGKDKDGYFAKDSSLNGTFINDKEYKGESFSLEEGVVYVADVPVYFKKNSPERPNVIPKLVKDSVENVSKTKRFDGFNNTKNWKIKKDDPDIHSPISR